MTRKMQSCVFKAIGAISNIASMFLDLKTNKYQIAINVMKAMVPLM